MLSEQDSLDVEGDDFSVKLISPLDGYSHGEEEAKLAESIVVKHAYYFFQISKVFLTDLIFTFRQREMSLGYFHKVSAVDALRVISVELHFIYEVLHTKALTIHSKWSYTFRFIAFIDIVVAFVLFNHLKKHHLPELDVKITYLLLFGGIALDVIAVLMLVFSYWNIAEIQWHKIGSSKLDSFLHNLVFGVDDLWKPRFATCEVELNPKVTYAILDTPLLFRRWSESIYACNLLSESLEKSPRKMYKRNCRWANIAFSNICSFPFYKAEKTISCFHQAVDSIARGCGLHQAVDSIARGCGLRKMDGKRSVIANMRYVSTNPFIMKLWIFIFEEVRRKSIFTINPNWTSRTERIPERSEWSSVTDTLLGALGRTKEIYAARGNWFLRNLPSKAGHRSLNDSDTGSMHEATDNEFPQKSGAMFSVTEASYYESIIIWHLATEICYNKEDPASGNDEREFSKILSDYMLYLLFKQPNLLYLLFKQPNLMSAVAGIAQIRLTDILRILRNNLNAENVKSLCEESHKSLPAEILDNESLKRGICLVGELEEVGEGKWKVMSGVWVEILSYAASHIKGEAHAQVLSKGGELLTFVWLLMIHFGLLCRAEWAPAYCFRC